MRVGVDSRYQRAVGKLPLAGCLACLAAAGWLCAPASASSGARGPGCVQQTPTTRSGSPPRAATRAAGGAAAVILTPADENSKAVERNFGEQRHIYRRTLVFNTSRPLTIDASQVSISVAGGIIDQKTTETFPTENSQLTFGANIDTSSGRLEVKLCIDPNSPESVEPGKYVGTILVSGPEISPTQIPIALTVKSDKWWLAWLLAFGGLVVGIGAKVVAIEVNDEPTLKGWRLVWTIGVGVAGSVLVVKKLYYDPATFGNGDFWPILVGAFGAALGGAGAASLVKEKPAAPAE